MSEQQLTSAQNEPSSPSSITAPSVTSHTLRVKGQLLNYTATAGTMRLTDDEGKPKADVFYMAYTADSSSGNTPRQQRPITFAFNGGPGSSSVWLHCGALGPKRLALHGEGAYPPVPPFTMIPNEESWLAWTDLVFIDPVGTGYSRPAGESKREEFHGVSEDVEWVGAFIRRYTSENSRWMSPKFLAGESYGTTRAAALANHLQMMYGMNITGIALISSVLSFQTIAHEASPGNDLPYACFLPALAATAWYHSLCAPSYRKNFQGLIDDAREFSIGAYSTALAKGLSCTPAEERSIASKISAFTGLSRAFIERNTLRIHPMHYTKEILRDKNTVIGRLDSRFTGNDAAPQGEFPAFDPSYSAILPPYTSAINHYLRNELCVESSAVYEVLTPKVHPWKWGNADKGYVNVAGDLASAMHTNPGLRIWIANGYYDLATPFSATEYTLHHLPISRSDLRRISMTYYHAGHMMYIHEPSLMEFTRDAEQFYAAALNKKVRKG